MHQIRYPNKDIEKPNDIIYGLYDKPSFLTALSLAIQQIFILAPYLILVSVVCQAMNFSISMTANLISITLIAMAIGIFLQMLNRGPLGSGYLAGVCPMPNYLHPSLDAIHLGGTSLMAGMILFSSTLQIVLGQFFKKVKFLFPSTLSGLVFMMIGLEMAFTGLNKLFCLNCDPTTHTQFQHFILFFITLGTMIALNIWGKHLFKLLSSAIGLIVGIISAAFMGFFPLSILQNINQTSWFSLPHLHFSGISFNYALIPPFLIVSIASVLRAMGAITTAQQINDKKWHRANQMNLQRGLLADGLTALVGGLSGTLGLGATPSSVGLSKACGATSRKIGYFLIIILVIMGFCPKIGVLFFLLPAEVMSAALLFVSCVLFIGGLRIITIYEIDARKTFLICLSLFAGISTQAFPAFYNSFPGFLHPLTSSVLTLGTLTGFILNLIFRIGIKRKEQLVVSDTADKPFINELHKKLTLLGVPAKTADFIQYSFAKIVNLILDNQCNKDVITSEISNDETEIIITISYEGNLPNIPTQKVLNSDDLNEENAFIEGLSALYRDYYPDHFEYNVKDGKVIIKLIFSL